MQGRGEKKERKRGRAEGKEGKAPTKKREGEKGVTFYSLRLISNGSWTPVEGVGRGKEGGGGGEKGKKALGKEKERKEWGFLDVRVPQGEEKKSTEERERKGEGGLAVQLCFLKSNFTSIGRSPTSRGKKEGGKEACGGRKGKGGEKGRFAVS